MMKKRKRVFLDTRTALKMFKFLRLQFIKAGFKISINYSFSQNNVIIKNEMYIPKKFKPTIFQNCCKKAVSNL